MNDEVALNPQLFKIFVDLLQSRLLLSRDTIIIIIAKFLEPLNLRAERFTGVLRK
jgi:hypothetical protein